MLCCVVLCGYVSCWEGGGADFFFNPFMGIGILFSAAACSLHFCDMYLLVEPSEVFCQHARYAAS